MSKYKLLNDPVHGFITIPNSLVFKIIEHPFFQRLRRISQMGMADYVYPGTRHTRFHHAIGAMHLMQNAIDVLRKKDIPITLEEETAALCAIVLHDIGHGPYSHALEYVMTEGINHEFFSEQIMAYLNDEFDGELGLALDIFKDQYPKKFLHQLVSSQLDVDRLDYLARDSFFSGVYEGRISTERIISMLNVVDDQLVVEEKGLYSIEKYIVSRSLMYWQVYLHKTAVCTEEIQKSIIRRAKELTCKASSAPLNYFLQRNLTKEDFIQNKEHIEVYTKMDDYDILFAIKEWQHHDDFILSYLSKKLIERKLFKVKMEDEEMNLEKQNKIKDKILELYSLDEKELSYMFLTGEVSNLPYNKKDNGIGILLKTGKVEELSKVSELFQQDYLTSIKRKYFSCYPKLLTS